MYRLSFLSHLLLLTGATQGSPLSAKHSRDASNPQIQWYSCNYATAGSPTLPTFCANLSVPLDYTDNSSQLTWTLELMKVNAVKGPSKGTVFVNYGGPGSPGLSELSDNALYQQAVTGGQYDLISVVPRGTGFYQPFQCWSTDDERAAGMLLINILSTASDVSQSRLWAGSGIVADNCYEAQNATGQYIGTAFVARDIAHVADILGETAINYWGISYGTVLGQTLAQMFPERMNRIILDGVVNSYEYYNNAEVEVFTNTDDVFAGFCQYCAAAPETCLIAQGNHTAQQISKSVFDLLENLKFNPIPIPQPEIDVLYDYSYLRYSIINSLYQPKSWPDLDGLLYSVATENTTVLLQSVQLLKQTPSVIPTTEALHGIGCSDAVPRTAELQDIQPMLDVRYALSKIGGDYWDPNTMPCAQWKFDAKERVLPEIGCVVHTSHPILLLSNRYDPVTPLVSARNTSARFEGSVVLETIAYGHSSLNQGSLCQAKLTQSYFTNGTLPNPGTVCEADLPFLTTDTGLDNIIKQLGFENANSTTKTTKR